MSKWPDGIFPSPFQYMASHGFTRRNAMLGAFALALQPAWAQGDAQSIGLAQDIGKLSLATSAATAFKTTGYSKVGVGAARLRRLGANEGVQPWEAVTADGVRLTIDEPKISLEMLGATPDGTSDCLAAFNAAVRFGRPIQIGRGDYYMSGQMLIQADSLNLTAVSIAGLGIGISRILIGNHSQGLWILSDVSKKPTVTLSGFSIGRNDTSSYVGVAGPKTIYVVNANGVTVDKVEEWGAIGMGIVLDGCENYHVTACHVHDHKNGAVYLGGTDGIHLYRSKGPGTVTGNLVELVGDDAISFGSYDSVLSTNDFKCFGNTVRNTAGSIKVYGNASRFQITKNNCTACHNGGVTIWDDQNVGQSFDVSDGLIARNNLNQCGGAASSGGVYLAQSTGDGVQTFRNIQIVENVITDCATGVTVSVAGPATKDNSGIVIRGNKISNTTHWGIFVEHARDSLTIEQNAIDGAGYDGILVQNARLANPLQYVISNNTISNASRLAPGIYTGIHIRDSELSLHLVSVGNSISGMAVGTNKSYGIVYSPTYDPSSVIANNSSDAETTRGIVYPTAPYRVA